MNICNRNPGAPRAGARRIRHVLAIGAALAAAPLTGALAQSQPFVAAGSSNQVAVAKALQSLPARSALRTSLQSQWPADPAAAGAAYDRLSGEIHAAVGTQMIEDSHFARDAAFARLSCAAGCADGSHLWAQAAGGWSHQGNNGNAGAISRDMGGVMGGVDTLIFDNRWRVGLLFGYDHARIDADSRDSTATTHDTTYGAYAGTQWGAFTLKLGAAYVRHDIATDRFVQVPGLAAAHLGTDYYGHTAQVFGELGYGVHWGGSTLQPYLQLAQVRQNFESFRESGGAAALAGGSHDADVTYSTLGVHFVADSFQLGTVAVNARAGLAWRHATGDVDVNHALVFRAGGSAYGLHGLVVSRNVGVLDAGLDFTLAPDAVFSLSYTGQAGSQRLVDQNVTAAMSVRF
ncbi:outer membrane autotransporter protein [Dyella sp. SG562]|uniref:autotransporter outer membrane beta-barrel domain-containing protein n=1 Tax=Dyella sp. SG562 TaxID=2587017 RepID=UPI001423EB77|nr:autotransporter domain-containing protein [Dyella sp. SG562]NII72891.1 outer membrane autotransporter protein [Dyella sp. SG562]